MEVLLLLRASILWILRCAQNDASLVYLAAQMRGDFASILLTIFSAAARACGRWRPARQIC